MTDGDFAIERSHGSSDGSGSISLDDDVVGLFLFEDGVEALDDLGTEGVQGLAGGHRCQIVVRLEIKEVKERREQVRVLAGVHKDSVTTLAADLVDEGGHFDHFWPGAEAEKNAGGCDCGGWKLNNHNINKPQPA